MKTRHKLELIYLAMFLATFILAAIFDEPYWHYNRAAGFIMLFNTILFLSLIKLFKIKKRTVFIVLLIILILFIIPIIDKDFFYSNYIQATQDPLMFPIGVTIISIMLAPFILIFDFIYSIGLFDLCYILIPMYIIFFMFTSMLVLSFNKHKNICENESQKKED